MTAVAEWQPGVYGDMPEDVYHADPVPGGSLSSSGARALLPPSCPAKFRYEREHPVIKDEFDFGTIAHKSVLGTGPRVAVIGAKDWRTNAAKDAAKAAREEGALPILIGDFDKVQAMAVAIRAHPLAAFLLNHEHIPGKPEQSLFWVDAEYPVWRRARADFLPDAGARDRLILTDYKTTRSADPNHIARAVASYGYHQQAAWYLDGVTALGLGDDPAFVFVFQEKEPPYLVTVAQLDDQALRAGRERNRMALEIFRDCTDAGVWPAYSSEIELISLPPWARSREEATW